MVEVTNLNEIVPEIASLPSTTAPEIEFSREWRVDHGVAYNAEECNHWQQEGQDRLYFRALGGDDAHLDLTDAELHDVDTDELAIEESDEDIRFYRAETGTELARITRRRLALTAADPEDLKEHDEDPSREDVMVVQRHNPRMNA